MISILQKIPRVEADFASESLDDITTVCTNRAKRVKDFLDAICENPETWTRDVLTLMGIEGRSQEEFIQKKNLIRDGNETKLNITSLASIDFEQSMDLESSYVNPSIRQIEDDENEQSNFNRFEESKPKSTSSLLLNKSSSSFLEYKVSVNQWRKSNEGNYIEYVLELSNFKGLEKRSINKRYSDFVFFHDQLLKNVIEEVPQLPPKNLEKTDEALNLRMKQLEEYINLFFLQNPINPMLFEFLEITNSGSRVFQELSKLKISSIECSITKCKYSLLETKKVEAVFESDIKIQPFDEFIPLFLAFTFTYEQIKEFNDDLKRISWLGDIDIHEVRELPPNTTNNGGKVLDKELMAQLQAYLNNLNENSSILNMILFKKFIADNAKEIDDDNDRILVSDDKSKLNLLSSVRGKSDLFKIRDVSPHGSDSDDQLF